jgi:hypothetical protein
MSEDHHPLLSIIVAVGDPRRFLTSYLSHIHFEQVSSVEFVFVINTHDQDVDLMKENFKDFGFNYTALYGVYDNPGSARNAGLEVCKGKWITFHDVDDHPFFSNIYNLTTLLQTGDFEIGCGSYIATAFTDGKLIEKFSWSTNRLKAVSRRPGIWRMVFKRELVQNHRFIPFSMGEDQHFLVLIGFASKKILYSNLNLYNYKIGVPNQLTSTKSKIHDLIQVQNSEMHLSETVTNYQELAFLNRLILRQSITLYKKTHSAVSNIRTSLFLLKSSYKLIRMSHLQTPRSLHRNETLVFLTGGLGNQMFQISAGLAQSQGEKVRVLPWGNPSAISGVPESELLIWPKNVQFEPLVSIRIRRAISYLLRSGTGNERNLLRPTGEILKSFLRIYLLVHGYGWVDIHIGSGIGYSPLKRYNRAVFLVGYFQSHVYPDYLAGKVQIEYMDNGIVSKFDTDPKVDKIAIHIRLGDYLKEDSFGIPDEQYYLKAIAMIANSEDKVIDLFTNSPELVVDYFPNLPWSKIVIRYSTNQSSIQVLSQMSRYRYLVIGNSTFSWWAAYLAGGAEKVIYPSPWFKELATPSMLCPERWSPCAVTFRTALPISNDSEK